MRGHDHLRNPLSGFHLEGLLRQVDQNDPNFTPVIGIDRPGRVQHGNPMFGSQPAPRTDLHLITCRQLHIESRRDHGPAERRDHHTLRQVGFHIHAGRLRRLVTRQFVGGTIDDFHFHGLIYPILIRNIVHIRSLWMA